MVWISMYCLSQNETCVRTDNFSHVCYFLVLVKIIKTGLVCCNDVPAAFIIMFQEQHQHGGIVHISCIIAVLVKELPWKHNQTFAVFSGQLMNKGTFSSCFSSIFGLLHFLKRISVFTGYNNCVCLPFCADQVQWFFQAFRWKLISLLPRWTLQR